MDASSSLRQITPAGSTSPDIEAYWKIACDPNNKDMVAVQDNDNKGKITMASTSEKAVNSEIVAHFKEALARKYGNRTSISYFSINEEARAIACGLSYDIIQKAFQKANAPKEKTPEEQFEKIQHYQTQADRGYDEYQEQKKSFKSFAERGSKELALAQIMLHHQELAHDFRKTADLQNKDVRAMLQDRSLQFNEANIFYTAQLFLDAAKSFTTAANFAAADGDVDSYKKHIAQAKVALTFLNNAIFENALSSFKDDAGQIKKQIEEMGLGLKKHDQDPIVSVSENSSNSTPSSAILPNSFDDYLREVWGDNFPQDRGSSKPFPKISKSTPDPTPLVIL